MRTCTRICIDKVVTLLTLRDLIIHANSLELTESTQPSGICASTSCICIFSSSDRVHRLLSNGKWRTFAYLFFFLFVSYKAIKETGVLTTVAMFCKSNIRVIVYSATWLILFWTSYLFHKIRDDGEGATEHNSIDLG